MTDTVLQERLTEKRQRRERKNEASHDRVAKFSDFENPRAKAACAHAHLCAGFEPSSSPSFSTIMIKGEPEIIGATMDEKKRSIDQVKPLEEIEASPKEAKKHTGNDGQYEEPRSTAVIFIESYYGET